MNETNDEFAELKRPTKASDEGLLFDLPPDWKEEWWGMPAFSMKDARPQHTIAINFMTPEDVAEFAKLTGLRVKASSDSAWFPDQIPLKGEIAYDGPKTPTRYPVCLMSKGRAATQTTGKLLDELGVPFRFFVEEVDYSSYKMRLGENRVVKLPFSDLGQGSIPARNFIWDWAKENGYARHWVMDDNITTFTRCHNNRRLRVKGGGFFAAMENFADRYENVALLGPHDQGFVPDREPDIAPFLLNSRVYSCTLIDTSLPFRWRGRYNEDTDLSLRVLKAGYCTVLFRALLMNKAATNKGDGKSKAMVGGNTDNVYNGNDFRREFAESIKEQHPDVVEIAWKFGRWHHNVDYSPFKSNRLKLRPGITKTKEINEYDMHLKRTK